MNNIASGQRNPEQINTSLSEHDQIKEDVQQLKASVENFKKEMDDFDKEKKDLAKEILEQRQQELEQKKQEIEQKKRETKERIQKLKKEVKENSSNDIDASLAELDQKINEDLDTYEKELDALSVETGFWGKLKETGNKVWEWTKENKKTLLIGGAVVGGFLLLRKLFKKKEKKEGDESSDEKPGFFKRALKWLGIGVGGVLVWKNRDWIKDKASDLRNSITGKSNETVPGDGNVASGSFEKLSEAEKQKYFQLSENISTFSTSSESSFDVNLSDDEEKDKKLKGSMLHGLDKKIINLSGFGKKEMLDFMYEKSTDDYIEKIGQWTKKQIHELLGDYLGSIASFQPFGSKFISDPLEAIKDWLAESVDRKEQLALFFKFYLNTFNYVAEKQKILKVQFATSIVMGKDRLNQEPSDKEQDAIEDLLFSDEFNENTYVEFLKKYTLADIPYLMDEYNIEVDQLSESTQDLRNNLQEDRDDAYSTDENGETCIVRAETEFLEGGLSEGIREELSDLCERMLDDSLVGTTKKSFFDAYTHLITDIFAGDEEYAKKIREKLEIEGLAAEIRATLVGYIEKLKNNTFDKQDLEELKVKSESYFNVRERMELTLHNLEEYSGGFGVDWWKVAQLPIDAFKDVGKAFGLGKTNSWRERIGYGLGGLYVSGHSLYIASRFSPIGRNTVGLVAKGAVEIGKLPVTAVQKGYRLFSGRRYMPGLGLDGRRWYKYITSSGFDEASQARLLRYSFVNGELSERQVLRIAKTIQGQNTITKFDDCLKYIFYMENDQIVLYNKYKDNKNIMKILFKAGEKAKPTKLLDISQQWNYNVMHRILKNNFVINEHAFKELTNINLTLEGLKGTNKTFAQNFLNHVKSLDNVDDLFKNSNKLDLILDLSKLPNSSNHAKILAKNFHKFSNLGEFEKYLEFLKSNKNNITNFDNFIINSIGKHKDILTNPSKYEATKILKMNQSAFQKQVEWMKKGFNEAAEKLKKIKIPKQFQSKIDKVIIDLKHLSNVSEENFRLLRFWSSNQNWVKEMKNDKVLIQTLQNAFTKPGFSNILKNTKTAKGLQNVFKSSGIKGDIPEGFFEYLLKNKNVGNVDDVLKYVNKVDEIGKIGKILTSPYMKTAGKVVGKVVAIAAPIVGGITAFMTYQEAREISKHNQERGDFKRQKGHWETTMAVLWGVDAAIAIGGTSSVIGAIPAWIVSGVLTGILGLAEGVKYYAYDSFDKYSKNYLDFAGQSELLIKQHISTVLMGKNKIDTGLGDVIARQFKDMSHLADKTSGEGIKALLYTQEREKNPLAMENTNDIERMKQLSAMEPPITREMIVQAQNEVDSKVNEKYKYFEKKCGTVDIDGKTVINLQKIITADIIERGESMKELDKLLRESEFSINDLDVDPDNYKLKLDEYPDKYDKLEKLWNIDIRSLIYFHRFSYDYKQLMENYLLDDDGNSIEDKKELIDQNLEYINDFISYKSLITGKDISLLLPPQSEENDMEKIRNFLITLSIDKQPSSKEIFGSDNTFQNVLYRIATEIIGVRIQNTQEDLLKIFDEEHEKKYGIYFKKGDFNRLCVNGNYFGDQEYVVNTYNIQKFKEDLQKKIDKNDLIDIGTGDKILNKEIGDHYVKIINEEIERK